MAQTAYAGWAKTPARSAAPSLPSDVSWGLAWRPEPRRTAFGLPAPSMKRPHLAVAAANGGREALPDLVAPDEHMQAETEVSTWAAEQKYLLFVVSYQRKGHVRRSTLEVLFRETTKVVNLGLGQFADSLLEQAVEVVQVDWLPPAGGDKDMMELLDKLL